MSRLSAIFQSAAANILTVRIACCAMVLPLTLALGCREHSSAEKETSHLAEVMVPTSAAKAEEVEARVSEFCGDCHRTPRPDYFARARWHSEVERGFRFFDTSLRTDLTPPPMAEVVAYYRERAPEALAIPLTRDSSPGPVRFHQQPVTLAAGEQKTSPAISFLKSIVTRMGERPLLFACDMYSGDLLAIDTRGGTPSATRVAQLGHPAHVEPCDLDADGAIDLVVADLGSNLPEDHRRGRVVWLRNKGDVEGYEEVVLLEGVGRVADVRPFDPDGDGDQDLVLAEFGWQTTGSVQVLINQSSNSSEPAFEPRVLDRRHGAIHVPIWDWNGDGHDDFVTLISQEHETIELFSSTGDGTFQTTIINPPEDPAFGSSGIELTDFDSDGDIDVIYTNGDTLDSYELKPYHGIHWIENQGPEGWIVHHLAAMPGVHRAMVGDLDGDGDNDVVAVAFLPDRVFGGQKYSAADFDSVIWLEQTRPGQFVRHTLEKGQCHHVALELADFDDDGKLDIAVGNFQAPGETSPVTLWLNRSNAE